jgi:hypothetical protein
MGGRYTPEGLQMTEVNATKNAEDRMRSQSMIQMAQQLQMPMNVQGQLGIGGSISRPGRF